MRCEALYSRCGVFVLGFSSVLTGLNFIVTVHKLRAPGLTWMKLPLFVWAIYATAIIQVLATPVLAITLLLLAVERTLGIGIFDPGPRGRSRGSRARGDAGRSCAAGAGGSGAARAPQQPPDALR